MDNNNQQLTRKQLTLLIVLGVLAFIALIVYIVALMIPHGDSSTDSTGGKNDVSYYDPTSKQTVTITPDRTPQGSDTKPGVSYIGFDTLTDQGMTNYNVRALWDAMNQSKLFKDYTIVSLNVDTIKLDKSGDNPVYTLQLVADRKTNYTVVDTVDNIDSAQIVVQDSHGKSLYRSADVTNDQP